MRFVPVLALIIAALVLSAMTAVEFTRESKAAAFFGLCLTAYVLVETVLRARALFSRKEHKPA